MGDQSWTRITIGGTLPARKFVALMDLLDDEFYEGSESATGARDGIIAATRSGNFEPLTWSGMCSLGSPNRVIAFCQKNELAFRTSWDAGGGYEAGVQVWQPGWADVAETEADNGGDVVVLLSTLQVARNEGKTLDDVIAERDKFDVEHIPALVLTFAVPESRMPAAGGESELERCRSTMFPHVTRVRSLNGTFVGDRTLLVWGQDAESRTWAEVQLDDDKAVEVETKFVEVVDG